MAIVLILPAPQLNMDAVIDVSSVPSSETIRDMQVGKWCSHEWFNISEVL